ncbi:MAG: hypothetical protein A2X49_01040 [Lentisphaerae bacterium GWF2_52_8]|nr:MAG: hypothetical protein A2X49_01040 [Lentisphaerae bacterium GWF2_52_8]
MSNEQTNNPQDTLTQIVRLSLELDIKACALYGKFASTAPSADLRDFWAKMSKEEASHVRFWKKTLLLAEKGQLPQIFDIPENIRREIQYAADKSDELISNDSLSGANIEESFLAAFRMEFYNLHQGLAPLFSVMTIVAPGENPDDSYSEHLNRFVGMFSLHCGGKSPGMQLMGEVIQRLWQDNRFLSRQCYMDDLSGLLNRRGFFNAALPLFELAKRNARAVGVILADIDDFKKINDTFGHQVGDEVITALSSTLKSSVRNSDLVARYGGEEFIVFCPEIEKGASQSVAEKLRFAVHEMQTNAGTISISLGAAESLPSGNDSAAELLACMIKAADDCLYQAKRSGKNRAICRLLNEEESDDKKQ